MGYLLCLRSSRQRWCRIGLASVALTGTLAAPACNSRQPASVVPPTREVAVVTIATEPVPLTMELPGRIAPMRIAEIRPQVSGLLLKRQFKEGADVRAGQQLYQIDSRPFEAAVNQARAALGVAQKNVDRARAALAASLANVERQKATLQLAQQNRQRVEASFAERAVSATRLDEAVTTQQVAEATLRAFEAQAESDKTAIAAAEAAVDQARAAVRLTENEQEIALTTYEKAIQTAFRETADTAAALGTIEDRIRAHTALLESASEAYRLTQVRYRNGIDSYLEVLDAQRSLYSAQQAMVWLQLTRISSQIRFYEVLGGQGFRP